MTIGNHWGLLFFLVQGQFDWILLVIYFVCVVPGNHWKSLLGSRYTGDPMSVCE